MSNTVHFQDTIPGGSHWSMVIRKGLTLRLIDKAGGANVGMLFYNPANLLERYNAPDTLKCQHTFRLAAGGTVSLTSVWHQVLSRPSQRHLEIFCERAMIEVLDDFDGPVNFTGPEADAATISLAGAELTAWLDERGVDTRSAETLALPLVAILGVLIFGGVVAASLPPMVGLIAVVVAMASVSLTADHTTVTSQALTVVSLLGLGLAIDYSLFIVNRFREELRDGRGREAAAAALGPTIATAGRTVIVSAAIVALSVGSLLVFPLAQLRSLAYGAIPAVVGAAVTAVTLLPAVLALLSHRVNAWHVPGTRRATVLPEDADRHGAWAAIAHRVMRQTRPVVVGLGVRQQRSERQPV